MEHFTYCAGKCDRLDYIAHWHMATAIASRCDDR